MTNEQIMKKGKRFYKKEKVNFAKEMKLAQRIAILQKKYKEIKKENNLLIDEFSRFMCKHNLTIRDFK